MSSESTGHLIEAELLKRCKQQDRKAQRALYERFSSRMFSVCRRYAKDRDDAEDLLQEGFITVFSKLHTYNASGSLEGWMRRIFVNTALMRLRKTDLLKDASDITEVGHTIDSGEDILSGIGSKDILKIMSEMPDGYRVIFNMYVVEGYSHHEIADALGVSEGTSRSQLMRARLWLQTKLREKGN